jgi:hypothetical protein
MGGYSRYCYVLQTPDNGSAVLVDLMATFTDAAGPTRIRERHRIDRERRTTVNRRRASKVFGFRWNPRLEFEIVTISQQAALAQITNRLARDDWKTELSLDAAVNFYEVEIVSWDGPTPLGGKTTVGAQYWLELESVELLSEIPYIVTGTPPVAPPYVVAATYSLPAAGAALAGEVRRWVRPGQPDLYVICLDDGTGSFSWNVITYGGS